MPLPWKPAVVLPLRLDALSTAPRGKSLLGRSIRNLKSNRLLVDSRIIYSEVLPDSPTLFPCRSPATRFTGKVGVRPATVGKAGLLVGESEWWVGLRVGRLMVGGSVRGHAMAREILAGQHGWMARRSFHVLNSSRVDFGRFALLALHLESERGES